MPDVRYWWEQAAIPLLSTIVFLPLAGAGVVWACGTFRKGALSRGLVLGFLTLDLLLSLALWRPLPLIGGGLSSENAGIQFVEKASWIPDIGMHYFLGVDGVSVWLILLTAFTGLLAAWVSWASEAGRKPGYHALMLCAQGGLLGMFCAQDLALFFLFALGEVIPVFFLMLLYGGGRREYVARKYFVLTGTALVFLLIAIISAVALGAESGRPVSCSLLDLRDLDLPFEIQKWVFFAFLAGCVILSPLLPFHTWFPDAIREAPLGTALLVGISGVKIGMYGMYRFQTFFPEAAWWYAPYIGTAGVVTLLYGAFLALVQEDGRKLAAYIAISQGGLAYTGLNSISIPGVEGAFLQAAGFGLGFGALLIVLESFARYTGNYSIAELGGLAKSTPRLVLFLLLGCLASLGFPPFAGFLGNFLIMFGAFGENIGYLLWSAPGILVLVAALFTLFQRTAFGKPKPGSAGASLPDLTLKELMPIAVMLLAAVGFGLFPARVLRRMEPSVHSTLEQMAGGKVFRHRLFYPPQTGPGAKASEERQESLQ